MNHANALAHLEEYFDGTLSPDVHRELESHLAGCTRCRDELSSLGALLDTVAEMRGKQVEPSRDLWPAIAAEIARGPQNEVQRGGGPVRRGDGGFATGGWNRLRSAGGDRRAPWPWMAGAVGLAAAALLLVAVLGGKGGRLWLPGGAGGAGGTGGERGASASPATMSADGAGENMARELAMLGAQVESSRQSVRPVGRASLTGTTTGTTTDTATGTATGTATDTTTDTAAVTPSWRLFDQGLAVLDQAIKDSRAALERDPGNPVLQKSLLAAYQKQLELIRWANRVVRQS
jgi:hypothetical protein